MDEINAILQDEITPRLDTLRGQKTHWLKWKANEGEESRLQRFCVAYSFSMAESTLNSSEGEKQALEEEQGALQAAQKEAQVCMLWGRVSCYCLASTALCIRLTNERNETAYSQFSV